MLTRALRGVRIDSLDKRSQVGVALRKMREELTGQLGGEDNVSPSQRVLIEETAKLRIIVAATGDWILRQEAGLVRNGELLPVVVQHAQMVERLAGLLKTLGLKRAPKPVESLKDYVARKDRERESTAPAVPNGTP